MPTAPDPALDAARERVVRLLTDRYADDTLTVEEFEARLDRMHALRDPAALDAMARELESAALAPPATAPAYTPAYAPAYQAPYGAAPTAPVPAAGAWALDAQFRAGAMRDPVPDHGQVLAIMSSTKRRGAWAVPRRLHAVAVMGEAVLDLREAVLPASCEIDVFALMGNVRVILPAGADAQFEVGAFLGAAEDHSRGHYRGVAGGGPHVRVTGLAFMGEVKVVGG